MRYKWIAVLLACVLLLCGCRQTGTDIAVSDDTTKTGSTSDIVTTTTASAATTASGTTITRLSNYTYDADRPITYAFLTFSNLEKYTDAVKTFSDKQAIYTYLEAQNLKNRKIFESKLAILLSENYFLVPQLPEGYMYGESYFSTTGHSMFIIAEKSAENGYLWVEVYHNAQGKQLPGNEEYTFKNARDAAVTRYTDYVYAWNEAGTPIVLSLQNMKVKDESAIKSYEELIKNLTFEKVEIK